MVTSKLPTERPRWPDRREHPIPAELRSIMEVWGRQQAAIAAETSRVFVDLHLTMAQFRVLTMIRRGGTMTGRDLAGRLGVTPGTLIPLIDRLEELGYLRRVPDLKDRRVTWLELTSKGERIFWRLFRAGGQRMMAAIAGLPPTERKAFRRILNHIADRLEIQRTPPNPAQV